MAKVTVHVLVTSVCEDTLLVVEVDEVDVGIIVNHICVVAKGQSGGTAVAVPFVWSGFLLRRGAGCPSS